MRTLSSGLSAALGGAVQRPALLAFIGFDTPLRLSSGAAVSWNGYTWAAADMRVDNLVVEALRVSGTLVLGNADGAIGTTVLADGVQDRPITLWGYDAAATGSADVVWLCSAVGASAQLDAKEARITLRHAAEFVASPRQRVSQSAGFTRMLPAGTVLTINGQQYALTRSGA